MEAKAATLLVCLALVASLAAGSAASLAPGEVSHQVIHVARLYQVPIRDRLIIIG